jgi:PEP-CTERM motif
MIAINRRTDKDPVRVRPLGSSRGGRRSLRTALLAGASLIALAALGAPGAARACSGATQAISAPTTGPINSNGGPITVGAAGTIYYGVSAVSCSITALTNSGAITGAPGYYGPLAAGVTSATGVTIGTITNSKGGTISGRNESGYNGGFGVSNSGTIKTLTNNGAINGANATETLVGGGGTGVSNPGTIGSLTNTGTISGGNAAFAGGTGGAGVSNSHQITTLTNYGTISGGKGVRPVPGVGPGGAGVFNATGATIGSLINKTTGMILGASGSTAGAGVSNAGTITKLSNSGTIAGGTGVLGAGVSNTGTITTFSNSGTIRGGIANAFISATGGVVNTGQIMTLTNTGSIVGRAGAAGVSNTLMQGYGGTPEISQLDNFNKIQGGAGAAGVLNSQVSTIGTLNNAKGGIIAGGQGAASGAGGPGVSNAAITGVSNGVITTLTNSGTITGGAGGSGSSPGAGGAGVLNAGMIGSTSIASSGLINNKGASIAGGSGASGGGAGGVGVSNSGTITALTNKGTIGGGGGGSGGGAGGAGITNSATITTVTNSGIISGGGGGRSVTGGAGGAGVNNSGTIGSLTNSGHIFGGAGAEGGMGGGGQGGAGVLNAAGVTTLTNTGQISGGGGGIGAVHGAEGDGVVNFGAITSLMNSGTIEGSAGVLNSFFIGTLDNKAGGVISGAQFGVENLATGIIGSLDNAGTISGGAYAIYSPGSSIPGFGLIGQYANTGKTNGNVLVDPSTPFVITGGSGKSFGLFAGGTITIGGGGLAFRGNTDLADKIVVDDGTGTVTNEGVLRFAKPETIFGNFDQDESGMLDFALAGDAVGQYGALTVTKIATLDGELALTAVDGFHLAAGDTFDLMTFGEDPGSFTGVSLGGVACTGGLSSFWSCGAAGFNLDISLTASGLDVTVAGVPEPSTWALMAIGFLGLAGLGLRGRMRAAASS